MKRLAVTLLACWSLASLAFAQAPPAARGGGMAIAPAHVDARITQMHDRLHITPDEEPAWTAFAQTMRGNAEATARAYSERASQIQSMTAVENLRSFAAIEQARAAGLQKLLTAFETLYASLSPEQKQTADAIFRRQAEHPRRGPRTRDGGPGTPQRP